MDGYDEQRSSNILSSCAYRQQLSACWWTLLGAKRLRPPNLRSDSFHKSSLEHGEDMRCRCFPRGTPVRTRGGNFLFQGETLYTNMGLYNDKANLVTSLFNGAMLWRGDTTDDFLWSSGMAPGTNPATAALTLQWDGALVYSGSRNYNGVQYPIYSSKTSGTGVTVLRIEGCGMALYQKYPNIGRIWNVGAVCAEEPDVPPDPPRPPTSYPAQSNRMVNGQFLLPDNPSCPQTPCSSTYQMGMSRSTREILQNKCGPRTRVTSARLRSSSRLYMGRCHCIHANSSCSGKCYQYSISTDHKHEACCSGIPATCL